MDINNYSNTQHSRYVHCVARLVCAVVALLSATGMPLLPVTQSVLASTDVDRTLPKRFNVTTRGDMRLIGNSMLTCQSTPGYVSCAAAQAGTNSGLNDKFFMTWNDVDADPATFNSTNASVVVPPGASVLWAGLYWGGNVTAGVGGQAPPNIAVSNTVKIAPPAGGYRTFTGQLIGTDATTGQSRSYAAFADVTAFVQGAGSGAYTVADIQTGTGVRDDNGESGGLYGGWGLLIIYRDRTLPLRDFNVWDSFFRVQEFSTGRMAIDEFVTPLSGAFSAKIGTMAFEGDRGLTGDSMSLNTTRLSDGLNPATNIFNGTITDLGAVVTRNPSFVNSLGIDVDTYNASGILPNGATTASLTLPTTADNYFPALVASAIDVFEPLLEIEKKAFDLNGGAYNPGDVIRYTIELTNTGIDTATKVTLQDVIPAGTTYLPGSLKVNVNPGGDTGAKTDAVPDDIAFFDSTSNSVRFYLGRGATPTLGGSMVVGERALVEFCVTVRDTALDGDQVVNTALGIYSGSVISATYSITDSSTVTVLVRAPDLSITKTDGGISAAPGDTVFYTLTVRNNARVSEAQGVVVTETLPPHTTFVGPASWTATATPGQYVRSLGTLAAGTSRSLIFAVKVNSTLPQGITETENIAVVAQDTNYGVEKDLSNNTTRDKTPLDYPDLAVDKDNGRTVLRAGDVTTYVITVTNKGTTDAVGVRVLDPMVHGMATSAWVCAASPGSTCAQPFGSGGISTTVSVGVNSRVVFTNVVLIGVCDGLIANRVQVISPRGDPTPDDNEDWDVDSDGDGANFWLRLSSTALNVGRPATYTVQLRNIGPDTGMSVTLQAPLPAGLTVLSASPSAGTYDTATGVWTVGNMPVGTALTLTLGTAIPAGTAAGTVFSETVTVDSPTLGNAPQRVTLTGTVTLPPPPVVIPDDSDTGKRVLLPIVRR
jgi:large repetitive protein